MKYGSAIILTLLFPVLAFGDVYIYPNKGQRQQQQSKDRYECHTWAVQQTGFDPSRAQAAAAPPSSPQPGKSDNVARLYLGLTVARQDDRKLGLVNAHSKRRSDRHEL